MHSTLLLIFLSVVQLAAQTDGARQLFDAIRRDDTATVKKLLASGVDANSRDPQGATALMHAALYASDSCVTLLLDKGASTNATTDSGSTALMWATGEAAKVKLLLARGADRGIQDKKGRTALHYALRRHDGKQAAALLATPGQNLQAIAEEGSDAIDVHLYRGSPAFLATLRSVGLEPVEYRLRGLASPLLNAAISGDSAMIRGMLDAGADARQDLFFATLKGSPLQFAGYGGNLEGARSYWLAAHQSITGVPMAILPS